MSLPRLAVTRPVSTAMAIVAAVALGALAAKRLPLQYLPEMAWPSVTVSASHPGSSPEEIERLVIRPLEARLATLPDVESITSTATANGATIRLEFAWSSDMDLKALEVREGVDLAMADLPDDLERPRVLRFSTADFSVVHLSVAWSGSRGELQSVVEERVVPALQRLPGVAAVEVHGLVERRVLVELDADRLDAHRLEAWQVRQALAAGNANVSAGLVERDGRRFLLRAVGELDTVEAMRALPLARGVRLGDVASVTLGHPDPDRVQLLDGQPSVLVEVYKTTDANMVAVAAGARDAVERLTARPENDGLAVRIVRDRSEEVVASLGKLRDAGLWGGLLAAIVLLAFLRQVRSTLIVLVSIPASVLVTLALMLVLRSADATSITLNLVSLTGLMLAVGMLVDNSVVVMENIYRRRREGLPARDAAERGATEVSRAVTASTLTTVVVFASLLGGGQEQTFTRWLSEFGLAMSIALVASLVVALSLVPMAAAWLFRRGVRETSNDLPRLGALYVRVLGATLRWRWVAVLVAAGLTWGAFHLLGDVERQPAPRSAERRVDVDVTTDRSLGMEQLASVFARLEEAIEPHRDELDVAAVVSEYGTGGRRPWRSGASMRLYLTPASQATMTTAQVKERVRELLPEEPGVTYRLERLRHWSGDRDVSVELSGRDPALLEVVAEDVRARLAALPSLGDVETNLEAGDEELRIVLDRTRAAARGVTPQGVARAVGTALGERPVTRFRTSDSEIEVLLRLEGADGASLDDLLTLEVQGETGGAAGASAGAGEPVLVPLSTLATLERAPGPRTLRRSDRKQEITVSGEPAEGGFFSAGREVERVMSSVELPAGVSWEMGRTFRRFERSERGSLDALLLALVLIYLVMASLFESLIHPLTILLSVPFALTGVAVAFTATSTPLDTMGWLGLLVLSGLVVNNGILLVDTIGRLRREDGLARREAILRAGRLRLRPILITSVTTLVGLFPLVAPSLLPGVFGELEGRSATWAPVALAVFGGLLTSTLLTLGVTPVLYSLLDDLAVWCARTWRGGAPREREAGVWREARGGLTGGDPRDMERSPRAS